VLAYLCLWFSLPSHCLALEVLAFYFRNSDRHFYYILPNASGYFCDYNFSFRLFCPQYCPKLKSFLLILKVTLPCTKFLCLPEPVDILYSRIFYFRRIIFQFLFFEIGSLCVAQGWPQTQDLPASPSQVLGLQTGITGFYSF
jgi:hypothetical protein